MKRYQRRQRRWLLSAVFSLALAVLAAVLADALLAQWRPVIDLSRFGGAPALSGRAQAVLADLPGSVAVACILPLESPAARPTERLLRHFAQTARLQAGADMELSFIEPRLNVAAAAQLMGQGARGTGLLLRCSGRHVFVPERALLDAAGAAYDPAEAEGALVSALARLSRPDGIAVGWLTGHGEPAFELTDPESGHSGFARALENEGFSLQSLLLDTASPSTAIPETLGALVVLAPRYPITAAERALIADWLERGGRLLFVAPASGDAGLGTVLERWGLNLGTQTLVPAEQAEGGVGMARWLSPDHPVTRDLSGHAALLFGAPRAVVTGNAARGVSPEELVRLRTAGSLPDAPLPAVMACAERGGIAGSDLAFRPGRVIVVGEPTFAENRYVQNHASANRDVLANAMRWLTGLPGSGARGDAGVLRLEADRRTWRLIFAMLAGVVPLAFCAVLWIFRRRRS